MTYKELYNIRYYSKEILRLKNRIAELRTAAESTVSGNGGMPSGGISDKVGSNAAKIADLEIKLNQICQRRIDEEIKIMDFVAGLQSARLRLIIQLFFIDGLSWNAVADRIGGTDNSCKQFCKRKLAELEQSNNK